MARTWRNERSTPKNDRQEGTKRPRMSDFARDYYLGQGYNVNDTVTAATAPPCEGTTLDCKRDVYAT